MNVASLHPAYPVLTLVAMARDANRTVLFALRIGDARLALCAARRRGWYMRAARRAHVTAPVTPSGSSPIAVELRQAFAAEVAAVEYPERSQNWWLVLKAIRRRYQIATAILRSCNARGGR